MGESFWQKDSLITHILFELCLYDIKPSPINDGTPSTLYSFHFWVFEALF